MGWFSFLRKNTSDGAAADASLARARSKRASHASGEADPVLPEKKRARRRLVGAIALAVAVAVGLPMILDTEPKPLASDIAIQIPAKDKPVQAAASAVAASAALDPAEQIVTAALPLKAAPAAAPPVTAAEPAPELAEGPVPLVVEAPRKAALKAEAKIDTKPTPKVETRQEASKPDTLKQGGDAARAMAILDGKSTPPAAERKFALQVAALATQDKVDELQSRLKDAGLASYTQKTSSPAGERIRVRLGPFGSKEEAEKARAKLVNIGLSGTLVPL